LWSNKKNKNAAMIFSRWVETRVVGAEAEIDRRWMLIDASDLDNQLTAAPTGAALTDIVNTMQQRGNAALSAQNDLALTKAEVSKTASKAMYRRDFDVGDIITVTGDYNESAPMQITEYVEIEDENGRSGTPTLALL
jgi:flagellar basal body L-ring protein FlgH